MFRLIPIYLLYIAFDIKVLLSTQSGTGAGVVQNQTSVGGTTKESIIPFIPDFHLKAWNAWEEAKSYNLHIAYSFDADELLSELELITKGLFRIAEYRPVKNGITQSEVQFEPFEIPAVIELEKLKNLVVPQMETQKVKYRKEKQNLLGLDNQYDAPVGDLEGKGGKIPCFTVIEKRNTWTNKDKTQQDKDKEQQILTKLEDIYRRYTENKENYTNAKQACEKASSFSGSKDTRKRVQHEANALLRKLDRKSDRFTLDVPAPYQMYQLKIERTDVARAALVMLAKRYYYWLTSKFTEFHKICNGALQCSTGNLKGYLEKAGPKQMLDYFGKLMEYQDVISKANEFPNNAVKLYRPVKIAYYDFRVRNRDQEFTTVQASNVEQQEITSFEGRLEQELKELKKR
ncbi:hypothetical protein DdX_06670 [Ditylenchus destructor]|uniref:Uncharacterized protein n=1 Tax=Ditylenchus destructor TaxID=166010 RepID=A0AAD4R965_9BILA|nr:hypothetical protein DdX_06670 [Ditylenchus destructor]